MHPHRNFSFFYHKDSFELWDAIFKNTVDVFGSNIKCWVHTEHKWRIPENFFVIDPICDSLKCPVVLLYTMPTCQFRHWCYITFLRFFFKGWCQGLAEKQNKVEHKSACQETQSPTWLWWSQSSILWIQDVQEHTSLNYPNSGIRAIIPSHSSLYLIKCQMMLFSFKKKNPSHTSLLFISCWISSSPHYLRRVQRALGWRVVPHKLYQDRSSPDLSLCVSSSDYKFVSFNILCNKLVIWSVNYSPEFCELLKSIDPTQGSGCGNLWFTASESEAQGTTWILLFVS